MKCPPKGETATWQAKRLFKPLILSKKLLDQFAFDSVKFRLYGYH